MPDGRFLSRSVGLDLELNAVSALADLLFCRMVPHLDVEGRLLGHPTQVKSIAVPLRADFTSEAIACCLGELADVGLVRWYAVKGRPYLEFPGFKANQKGLRVEREAKSKIPGPKVKGTEEVTASLRTYSGATPDLLPPKLSKVKVSTDTNVSGASPDVENSRKQEWDTFAGWFRTEGHKLEWMNDTPPIWAPKDWSIERSLSIWRSFYDQGEELDVIRKVIEQTQQATTAAYFWGKGKRNRWNEAAAKARQTLELEGQQVGEIMKRLSA